MAWSAILFLALLRNHVVEVQTPGRAVCLMTISSRRIALSDELRLTMSVEGPAPVEVDVPRQLSASTDWRVRAEPARLKAMEDGRERWTQTFVLDPYNVGKIPLKFEPIRFRVGNEVLEWPLNWKPLEIQVESMVKDPDRAAPQPVTGIEELPPAPSPPRGQYAWLLAIPVAAALILLGWRWRRRPEALPISATERALQELHKLADGDGPSPEHLPHLADILRRFLESRLPLAATRLTTSEFLLSLRQVEGLDEKTIEKVSEVLTRCDLVKFAGIAPDRPVCQTLLQNAREAITQFGQPGRTSSDA
jgi:hypothetical protein